MYNQNRMNDKEVVVNRLKVKPEIASKAYIVGSWVWISFNGKPDLETREFLKAEGFIYNSKREAWQHCGGHRSVRANYDPRTKYGIQRIDIEQSVTA